jgi:hypothetical protein
MPEVRFEPTISVFERAKTAHALDCPATLIAILYNYINGRIIQTLLLFTFLNQNFTLMELSRGSIGISNLVGNCAGFEVLRAVTIKSTIFWDVTPCSLVQVYRRLSLTSHNTVE